MVLQKMRAGAQGLLAKVLVGLIVFVLAVTGFGAIQLFSASEPVAASVNGDDITQSALQLETSRQRSFQRGRFGDEVSDEMIDRMVPEEAVLDFLVDQTLLNQAALDLSLSVSEAAVQARIRRDFAGDDDLAYRNRLASQGYTPSSFQAELANVEIREQVSAGWRDTAFVTGREQRGVAEIQSQRRDIAWLLFDLDRLAAEVDVTDQQIEEHYGNLIDNYMTEERFDFDFVRLPRSQLEAEVEVDETAVVAAYEDEVAAIGPRRRAAHILLEVNDERSAEEATRILDDTRNEVLAGADFAEKARQLSEDAGSAALGGDLGATSRGVFAPAFETALWALQPGEMSAPVETEFGIHLIRLDAIEEPEVPPLEERRSEIVANLTEVEAQRRFEQVQSEMDEIAFEQSESLDAVASEYGLDIERLDGATATGGQGILAERHVRDALFGEDVLLEGFNSRVVATAAGDAVVARLRHRHPATERPLDEVREAIRDSLAKAQAQGLAEAAAFTALSQLAGGATAAEVEQNSGVDWQRADGVQRNAEDVPPAIIEVAFKLDAPASGERAVEVALLDNGSRAVVLLSAVTLGDYGALTETERTAIGEALQQLNAQRDYAALLANLRADAAIDAIDFNQGG